MKDKTEISSKNKYKKKYLKLKKKMAALEEKYENLKTEKDNISNERNSIINILRKQTNLSDIKSLSNTKKKPYYGSKKIPGGKRRPTMRESIINNKVNWFGVNKIDPRLLAQYKYRGIDTENAINDLQTNLFKLRMEKKEVVRKYEREKDPIAKDEFKENVEELSDKIVTILAELNNLI
jgi:hypothetical protein